jgi:hypothetical protein
LFEHTGVGNPSAEHPSSDHPGVLNLYLDLKSRTTENGNKHGRGFACQFISALVNGFCIPSALRQDMNVA